MSSSTWWGKNRRRVLQSAGTVLAVFLLFSLVKEDGWNEILQAFRKIESTDLLLATLLFFTSRTATAARWHILLRYAGIGIRFKDTAGLTYTGLYASNFLPSTIGGDVVKLAGVMQLGYDRAVCLASIAADRLIGMFGMTMVLPVGLSQASGLLQTGPASLLTVAWFKRPIAFLKRTFSASRIWFQKPASLVYALAFSWIHMLCVFTAIYIFVNDLGPPVSFWMIAGLWSLTYFVTLLPISINGFGLQELSFTFFMSNVAGLTPAVGLSVAVLIRGFFILSSLPGAFFLSSVTMAIAKQKQENNL